MVADSGMAASLEKSTLYAHQMSTRGDGLKIVKLRMTPPVEKSTLYAHQMSTQEHGRTRSKVQEVGVTGDIHAEFPSNVDSRALSEELKKVSRALRQGELASGGISFLPEIRNPLRHIWADRVCPWRTRGVPPPGTIPY